MCVTGKDKTGFLPDLRGNKLHSRPRLCPAPAGDEASRSGYLCARPEHSLWLGERRPTSLLFLNNFVEMVHPFEVFVPVVFYSVVQPSSLSNSRAFVSLQKETHTH